MSLLPLLYTVDYADGCTWNGEQLGPILAEATRTLLTPPLGCAVALTRQSPVLQAEAVTRVAAMGSELPRTDTFLVLVQAQTQAPVATEAAFDELTTRVFGALKAAVIQHTGRQAGIGSCVLPVPAETALRMAAFACEVWSSTDPPITTLGDAGLSAL